MEFEEIKKLGNRYRNYYEGRVDRDLCMKLKRLPRFEVGEDSSAWTGPAGDGNEVIHIGLGLLDKFPDGTAVCENEFDFHCCMRFLTGHESGHQKYTTDRSFSSTIKNGYFGFVEYAVKEVAGRQIRMIKESDYDAALDYLSKKYGVRISHNAAVDLIHFIVNSIEDGRMERNNMQEKPGFKDDVIMFRGKTWIHTPVTEAPDISDPRQRLLYTLNQVLSLATMGVWQKGFSQYIVGTEIESFVRQLKPDIDAAVTSRSCARGMRFAGNVIRSLYPLLLEACKMTDFEKMVSDLLSAELIMLPDMDPEDNNPHSFSVTEKEDAEREKDDGSTQGPLQTDIFKKSEENSEKGKSEESGESINTGSAGKKEGNDGAGSEKNKDAVKRQELENDDGAVNGPEEILAAMEAASNASEMSSQSAMLTAGASEKTAKSIKEVDDNSLAADSVGRKELEAICSDYNEYTHVFELKDDLPLFISQECSIIRRQYERYFKSRKKPVRRNQKSGKLDPHQLSRLVRGDMDVYRKLAKDDTFSGCIEIFLDNSGSMAGYKKEMACETLARIEECLKGLVPVKICAFDSWRQVNVEIIKNWNEVNRKNCSWNFLKYGRKGDCTPTKEVLMVGEAEMLRRQERHKMIILLTDEKSGNDLKEVIRRIRSENIQLCAIYFDNNLSQQANDSFHDLFDNLDAITCEPSEIGKNLLPVVKKFTEQR